MAKYHGLNIEAFIRKRQQVSQQNVRYPLENVVRLLELQNRTNTQWLLIRNKNQCS